MLRSHVELFISLFSLDKNEFFFELARLQTAWRR
jgi:hypothetical protein